MRTYGENSNDPYSALIIHGSYNDPCKYTSHGFDGIRAFKTRFVKPGKAVNIKIGNEKYNSIKCIGYFDPIVGYKESDFLDQVSKPGSVKYWYKFLEKENLWLPVKVIIETPLGGFVNNSDDNNCVRTVLRDERYTKKWNLIALKNIKKGEELTLKYTFYRVDKADKK